MSHSAKKQKWVNYVKIWQSYSGRNDNCHIPQKIATFNCNISPKMWHSIVTFRSAKCYNQLSHFCAKCDNWMSHFSRNVTIDISRRNMIVIFTHKIFFNWPLKIRNPKILFFPPVEFSGLQNFTKFARPKIIVWPV